VVVRLSVTLDDPEPATLAVALAVVRVRTRPASRVVFYPSLPTCQSMDRKTLIALVLVILMVVSPFAYALSF